MKRGHWVIFAGILSVALSACGDDTAKANNANPFDLGEGDIGNDVGRTGEGDMGPGNNGGVDMPSDDMPPALDVGFDGGAPDTGPDPTLCGNSMVDEGEECDDGNDDDTDDCNSDCTLTCGDGVLAGAELCDPAIPAGMAGACPTSCDDQDACTTDTLDGAGCQVRCVTGVIAACVDGDGCCPSACNGNTDDDCAAVCGNGVVEPGETCEGNCPTTCDDGVACTADTIAGSAATCDVMCTNTMIAACVDGDGCCPSACNSLNDNDCSATCGNNVVDAGETCDGNCPTSCSDNNVCTADVLIGSAQNCSAACSFQPLGCVASAMDGCCPSNCNATNDPDCSAMCGNSIVEPGETCDDGNTAAGDGCDATCQLESGGIAFRLSDLDIRDPHVFVSASILGCRDLTDNALPLNLSPSLNSMLQEAIQQDTDADGTLDLSFVAIFNPLDQSNGGTGQVTIAEADCTAPMAGTSCVVNSLGATFQTATYTTDTTANCLDVLPGTVRPYTPAVSPSTPTCFRTSAIDLTLEISGIQVPLTDVQIGATYSGVPASSLANGLLRGFISEASAEATVLPASLPLIGGDSLASLLPGGNGSCANHDGRDVGPDGITVGWWFYLNFPATVVPVTVQ